MENTNEEKKNWLQELSKQSWNLELLVSGAALFSASYLPDLTEYAIGSYFENFQSDEEIANRTFPILAYSFAKASSYLLMATFFVHFVLRAFWIGMVGLRAVYPQGINYDNIPYANDQLKEIYRKKFGSFDDFIIRLDRMCSQIFSIAFLLVLFSFLIVMIYSVIFLIILALKTYSEALYKQIRLTLGIVFAIVWLVFTTILMIGSKKKYRDHPVFGKIYVKMVTASSVGNYGIFRALQYINFVFSSNVPRKRYLTAFSILGLTFFMVTMGIMAKKTFETKGIPFLESRNYFSTGSQDFQLNSSLYDDQRVEGHIPVACIQSDVIQEPFLKLFINYGKVLDVNIAKIHSDPKVPDSLSKYEKRFQKDQSRLVSLAKYFQIVLNDSSITSTEYLYAIHGDAKGISTYLPTEKCMIGKNMLHIKSLDMDSLPKQIYTKYVSIPFWYAKP